MIRSRHACLDTESLERHIQYLKTHYRRTNRRLPETASPVPKAGIFFQHLKISWRQRVKKIPLIGTLVIRCYRGWRVLRQPGSPLRQSLRQLPVVGKILAIGNASFHLPELRHVQHEHNERIAELQLRLTKLEIQLAQENMAQMQADQRLEKLETHSRQKNLTKVLQEQSTFATGSFYSEFSARFRGSDAAVEKTLEPYLDPVLAAIANREVPQIVDIGSGNGPWLRLLKQHGLNGIGFDLDPHAVQSAQSQRLDVRLDDGIFWLENQPPDSIDVVSAFQVIEHLPLDRLLAFLAAAHVALRPGGLLICETPNPENLIVGACSFYMDPTHRNPIPHTLAKFLAEYSGFAEVRIQGMNPHPESSRLQADDPAAHCLNELLFGAQDYALIAIK